MGSIEIENTSGKVKLYIHFGRPGENFGADACKEYRFRFTGSGKTRNDRNSRLFLLGESRNLNSDFMMTKGRLRNAHVVVTAFYLGRTSNQEASDAYRL